MLGGLGVCGGGAAPAAPPQVRVRNRFAGAYPAGQSAGYRDVSVHLRLPAGPVPGHVCELQLLLAPFARLKSDRGHRRYIAFRNAMGF